MSSLVRKAINAAAHTLAQREFHRFRTELQAEIDEAEEKGLSIADQLAIVRARLAPAREE